MSKKAKIFLIRAGLLFLFCLCLSWPLMSFKFGINSEIFPAFDLMLIYYYHYRSGYRSKHLQVLSFGIILDGLYSMPVGVNSVVLILGNICLQLANRFVGIKASYIVHLFVFCLYCAFVQLARCAIMSLINQNSLILTALIFQSLATIFAYPLLKNLLDKSYKYINSNNVNKA